MNSYVSLDEAQCYFDTRLYIEPWQTASRENRQRALVTATSLMEEIPWRGVKEKEDQILGWPRVLRRNQEAEFPWNIKKVCCELALNLLSNPDILEQNVEDVRRVRAGSIEVEFRDVASNNRAFPTRLMDLLHDYIDFRRFPGRTVEVWRYN